jgi:type VI protein secretion system component VasF
MTHRLLTALAAHRAPHWAALREARRGERGDVPGWVMITVMTAGLVAAIWAVAGPELVSMLRDALGSVG